jgi:hypothetical protein
VTSPNDPIRAAELPAHALLARYRADGAFADCHVVDLPRRLSHADFVEAFFTSPVFGAERRVLALLVRRPATVEQARRLASGTADDEGFAAWTVEARADRQLLLRDLTGRTRTWLMTEPIEAGATRLYLGSAVLPVGTTADGRPRMGMLFGALRGVHGVYSRALLGSARARLLRARHLRPEDAGAGGVRPREASIRGIASDGAPRPVLGEPPIGPRALDASPGPSPAGARPTRGRRRSGGVSRDEGADRADRTERTDHAPAARPAARPPGRGPRPPWRARPTPEQIAAMPPFEALPIERILLVATPADADDALRALRTARVVGFDTESKPTFTRDAVNDGPHVIQFATRERGFIVQVNARTPIDFLRAVLDTEDIVKVGFGLDSDRGPLELKLGLRLRGTIDVSNPLRRLGHKDALGAKAAVAVVLGRRLQKSKRVQTSNWGAPTLTPQQIVYAANDAYAALKVFEAIDKTPA